MRQKYFLFRNGKRMVSLGGSPDLVIMGDDLCSRGRGFESRRHILDGHFFSLICCKNWIVCLKRPKINEKEAGIGTMFFVEKNRTYLPTNIYCWDPLWVSLLVAEKTKGWKSMLKLKTGRLMFWTVVNNDPVWPEKNQQMSIKVAQKWFHKKN